MKPDKFYDHRRVIDVIDKNIYQPLLKVRDSLGSDHPIQMTKGSNIVPYDISRYIIFRKHVCIGCLAAMYNEEIEPIGFYKGNERYSFEQTISKIEKDLESDEEWFYNFLSFYTSKDHFYLSFSDEPKIYLGYDNYSYGTKFPLQKAITFWKEVIDELQSQIKESKDEIETQINKRLVSLEVKQLPVKQRVHGSIP